MTSTPEPKGRERSVSRTVVSPKHIFDKELFDKWETSPDPVPEEKASFDLELQRLYSFTIEYDNGIFAMKWSPDAEYLAIGCSDGGVRILTKTGRLAYRLNTSGNMPVTAMKWKTTSSGVGSSSVLITTNSSGVIDCWHIQSQKNIYSISEENNQIFCLDYSLLGGKFGTAGKDQIIRVYDEKTNKLVCNLEKGFMSSHVGHSNRIFALKWKPDDENIILSGGWDNTVLFWDLRSKNCFRSIYGPHIAGQTVDFQNDTIVTGSWRIKDTVQIWEFKTGKEIKTVNWKPSPMIYSCAFCPTVDGLVAAGGTGINTMRLIDVNTGAMSYPTQLTNKQGIYCLDWEPVKGNLLAIAGHCEDISIFSLKRSKK